MGVDLHTTTAAAPLERDVVLVSGPEAVEFLQGQLSQDLLPLAIGASTPALLLQPTGKALAWVRATAVEDDALALDVDAGMGEAVLARLSRFKLRTKADLELRHAVGWGVRGPVPVAAPNGARPVAWPGVAGLDLLDDLLTDPAAVVAAMGVPTIATADDLEALRIECGVPASGTDLTEETIPAEAGQWLVDASVSFTKGCYTGQELVARIDSRGGNVPRPLRGLVADAPLAAGATVTRGGEAVGHVTSAATSPVLGAVALAPIARSVEVGTAVEVDGTGAVVHDLPMR